MPVVLDYFACLFAILRQLLRRVAFVLGRNSRPDDRLGMAQLLRDNVNRTIVCRRVGGRCYWRRFGGSALGEQER